MSPPPLEHLFRDFLTTGNEDALALWMRRSGPPLRQLALRLGATTADVEDLVQETFVAAIHGADRYDADRPMLPWLKGILTFRAARLARDEVRRTHHYQASTQNAPTAMPAPDHAHVELDGDVREAIDDLPEQYHEPLTQYLLAQRSPVEIAESMGVKRATVRVRLHRGLQRLRDALRRWGAMMLIALFGRKATAGTGARVAVVLLMTLAAFYTWPADAAAAPGASEAAAFTDVDEPGPTPSARNRAIDRTLVATDPVAAVALGTLVIRVQHAQKDPVANVGIAIEPAFGKDPVLHRRTYVTDEQGSVICADLAAGTWNVMTDRGQHATIDVARGAQEQVLTVVGGQRVTGAVVDDRGQPAANALIWLSRGSDGPWRGHDVTQTDAVGRFELDNVPVGAFLAARHPHYSRSAPQKIGSFSEQVTLQLAAPGGRIALQVHDRNGQPVGDAMVFVGDAMDATPLWLAQGAAPWCPPPFTGRTDARGKFVTAALATGEHPVFVRAPGYAPYRAVVRVDARTMQNHPVKLSAGAKVRGVVRDTHGNGISNAMVVFRHNDVSASIDACSDPDGRFVFECLPTGAGQILAKASGFAVGTTHVDLQLQDQDCAVTLAATHDIVGSVLVDGREPPRGTLVRATWPPSALRDTTAIAPVEDLGRFVFANATTASRPTLRIRLGEEPIWRDVDEYAVWQERELSLHIPPAFQATGWIRGRCLGDDGKAIANARIHVCGNGRWSEVGRTDASGCYRIGPLAPASYRVFAESTQRDAPTVVTDTVALLANTERHVDLTARASGQAAIELRRQDGKPVTDVLLTIQRTDLHRRFAIANEANVVQCLEAGDYVLSVMGSSVMWIDEHRFTVRPGAVTPVSVELQPAHRCTLALTGFPPRADNRPSTVVIRSVADEHSQPTVTLLPDAPLRIGAVLAPGSYWLEHTGVDGSAWRGSFDVATVQEALQPIIVPFAQNLQAKR